MSLEEKLDLKNKEIIKKLKIKSSLTEIISPNNFFSKEFREYNINGMTRTRFDGRIEDTV